MDNKEVLQEKDKLVSDDSLVKQKVAKSDTVYKEFETDPEMDKKEMEQHVIHNDQSTPEYRDETYVHRGESILDPNSGD